jgi:predicted metal-dependent hydrolase
MSDLVNFTILRSNRSSLAIQIKPDGSVIVKAPHLVPKFLINRFVSEHSDWIQKQLDTHRFVAHKSKQYTHGEEFLYLGKPYVLDIGAYTSISVSETKLCFPRALQFRTQKELLNWYQKEARLLITKQVALHSEVMGVSYGSITFSDTKSKWGSCSHDNNLQFNWRLVMAPFLVLNYVVIHELTHIHHKNHSQAFWMAVAKHNPSYRQQRLWLKKYGDTLVL